MTSRIEHHSMSRWPAARIHAALVDEACLRERLDTLGGAAARLVSHTVTEHEVRFQLRQQLPEQELPGVIRGLLGGNPVVDRSETWRRQESGHFVGEVAATLQRVPSTITGSLWLRDLTPGEEVDAATASGERPWVSEFVFHGEVSVPLPFLTDRAEELLAGQVRRVIARERKFLADWLSRADG
ncbi:DUF2505 domain-containing protein [Actinopolyspora sp. H202]|uniref:DUF2505 domain-containing protein n=1 Tax=Actinopolyspora sp. H202 TaxID=1500456 RepID=UPI003EE80B18